MVPRPGCRHWLQSQSPMVISECVWTCIVSMKPVFVSAIRYQHLNRHCKTLMGLLFSLNLIFVWGITRLSYTQNLGFNHLFNIHEIVAVQAIDLWFIISIGDLSERHPRSLARHSRCTQYLDLRRYHSFW